MAQSVSDMEWNFSLGREVLSGVVARASYVGTHGWHLPQNVNFNAAPPDYVWYTATGQQKATGKYASTGQNAYDTTTYGSITEYMKRGYSNANGLTLELERRYSRGVGFQLAYVMTNAFTESTLVGNGGGSNVAPVADFLAGTVPANFDARNRFLNYQRDSAIPHHQLKWNWVVDLPFGPNHLLASHAGKFWNTLIGGWQLAGSGTYQSRYISLPTSNYGPTGNAQVYGTKYPIGEAAAGHARVGSRQRSSGLRQVRGPTLCRRPYLAYTTGIRRNLLERLTSRSHSAFCHVQAPNAGY